MTKTYKHHTVRFRWLYIALGTAILIVGLIYGTGVFNKLQTGGFNDPNSTSSLEASEASTNFKSANPALIVLFNDPRYTVLQPAYEAKMQSALDQIKSIKGVNSISTVYNSGQTSMISKNSHETYALITIDGNQSNQTNVYQQIESTLNAPAGMQISLGGPAAENQQISDQVKKDLALSEKLSFPVLAILLIIIFRSLIAAVLPLIIGALGILFALTILRLIASVTGISIFATNIITLLGLGLAIDYSLFFVSRFREELEKGEDVDTALHHTRLTAGRTIMFSGTIVTLSLLSLLVFPEVFLRSMAYGGAATVLGSMLTALTILPAVLSIIGRRINRLRLPLPKLSQHETGWWWQHLAAYVTRRYITVIVVTLVVLLIAGLPFLHAEFGQEDTHDLPPASSSRLVNSALMNDFVTGQTNYVEVIVGMPGSPVSRNNLISLKTYTDKLGSLDNVSSVTSIVTAMRPNVTPIQYSVLYAKPTPMSEMLLGRYVHNNETLIQVNYDSSLDNSSAQALVKDVRQVASPSGSTAIVGGTEATLVDLLSSLWSRLPITIAIVVFTAVILLGLMLRSVVIPLTAMVLSVISLSASFGAITWIFQDGHGQKLLDFSAPGFLDSTVPVLIFVVAFGLAMDYEAFLISRMRERFTASEDNTKSIVFGVSTTGRVISSAALLLLTVILALSTSKIVSIKEIGVGLAIAVVVDVVAVRSLLVPATMRLFGKANWWLPGNKPKA